MTVVSVAAGAALVLLVAWDIGLTVLHPAARGPLSHAVNRATWRVVRTVAPAPRRALSFAGPLAMATSVASWLTLMWIGFALVYWPHVEQPFYLSAEALTTVGFGDVTADTDELRLLSAFEAGAGLGAFTAAIAFVLSVYPLVTEVRAAALHLDDLGATEPETAARLIATTGVDELARIHEDLIEVHEHVRRFPVLYYFESGDEHESLTKLVRGGSVLVIVLRWGLAREAVPEAAVYATAIQRTMSRLLDDLESGFIGGRGDPRLAAPLAGPEELLAALRAAVGRGAPELTPGTDHDLDAFAAFTRRAQAVVDSFAREHRQEEAALIRS